MSRNSSEDSRFSFSQWNRALSTRLSQRSSTATTSTSVTSATSFCSSPSSSIPRSNFFLSSLPIPFPNIPLGEPALSQPLHRLIKSLRSVPTLHNSLSSAYTTVSSHLTLWSSQTGDDAVTDLADKLSVLLGEIGRQEAQFACRWEEVRGMLKVVRGTERGVARVRMLGERCRVEVGRLRERVQRDGDANGGGDKGRRLVEAEMELVRLEAEELVAEAQLGGVTRHTLKASQTLLLRSLLERSEKQAILARHGLRLLSLLDSTPLVPGEVRPAFPATAMAQARQILNDAEDDLRTWELSGMDRMLVRLAAGRGDGNGGGDGDGDGDGDGGIPEEEGDGDRDEGGAEEDEREEEQTAPPVPPRPRKKGKSKQESLGSESGSEGGVEG